jgi:4-amino-4-deoxy-L-arabinose transferase-like glycosyltransferase
MDAPATPEPQSRAIPLWLLLLLPALTYLTATGLDYGSQAISGPDEPRYAAAAREMLRTGDWLVPRFNGQVRLEKPILLYWSCALFSLVFGVGPLACRLGPVLAGLGTVLVTAGLASRLYGRRAGLLAGLILSTTWYFPQIGRTVLSDMFLTCFVVAAVALLRVSLEEQTWTRRRKLLLFGAYACCSLAVLTKGPVGLLLPFGIMAAWLWWEGRPFAFIGLLPLSATVTTTLLAGPWYLAVYLRGGAARDGLLRFLGHENYNRFFHSFDHLDVPWKYVTTSVPQGMMPWTLLLPAGLLTFWVLGRKPAPAGTPRETTDVAFPMVWAGAVIGLFSATGQLGIWPWVALVAFLMVLLSALFMYGVERYWKWIALAVCAVFALVVGWVPAGGREAGGTARSFYVLAAYPALAIAAAWALDRLCVAGPGEARWARRGALAVPVLCALGLLVVGGVAALELFAPEVSPLKGPVQNIADYRAESVFAVMFWRLLICCPLAGAIALFMVLRRKLPAALMAAALGIAVVQGCYWGWAIPMRDRVVGCENFYQGLGKFMADPETPVISYDLPASAEAIYYLDRPVVRLSHKARGGETLRQALAERKPRYLIIRRKQMTRNMDFLASRSSVIVSRAVRKRKEYCLLAVDGARVIPK